MHTKISLSFGVEFPLELFELWIIRSPVCNDENRLEETQRRKTCVRWEDVELILKNIQCVCFKLKKNLNLNKVKKKKNTFLWVTSCNVK